MNELHKETSPYLLQHQNNPIHWKAWNPESLALAKEQRKLMVISIGYSACHWCHVMEHESFESNEVAEVMNQSFISIKVDREEHPDVDAIYMKALQLMTRQGGWPLNVVTLPDGRPIWGGTYFDKNSWISALQQLQKLYKSDPERIYSYADQLHQALDNLNEIIPQTNSDNFSEALKIWLENWKKSFDLEYGGYQRAPKFMMPSNVKFLLHYGLRHQEEPLMQYVHHTLKRMAWGGIFDVVQGGFSRYSVDHKWHVPHFEKMLYDNAQLLGLYSQAYQQNPDPLYKDIVYKTYLFIKEEWQAPQCGIYSALDADSLNGDNKLEEGAYYYWTKAELKQLLGPDFDLFAELFNINDFGHWENSHYVLIQNTSLERISSKNNIPVSELQQKKSLWEQILLKARAQRNKPRLDNKVICSWNAMYVTGLTKAYLAFGNDEFLAQAENTMNFILIHLWDDAGQLARTHSKTSKIPGVLEDYAFVVEALIAMYQASYHWKYLILAKQITDYTLDHFYNPDKGLFRYNVMNSGSHIIENYDIEDNVIPCGNSVMGVNLYYLSVYFQQQHYLKIAEGMRRIVLSNIDYASAFSNWLELELLLRNDQKEICIIGDQALEFAKEIQKSYHPEFTLAVSKNPLEMGIFKDRYQDNTTLIYVCEHKVCQLPIPTIEEFKMKYLC